MTRLPSLRILTFLLVFTGGLLIQAQINTASLSGLAVDPSGAALPHVSITVTDDATGYTRTVQTDDAGAYSMQDLPIGQYTVSVTASGFTPQTQHVPLAVGQRVREDFHLRVGSTEQSVEVQSNSAMLSPDDASISTVIGAETIEETPLSLRNWDDLLRVVPGVQISRFTQQSAPHRQVASATSMSTASTPYRTTSCSTASITIRFQRMCRN
jgi:hypothetical protein